MAIEFARKMLMSEDRPTFLEIDEATADLPAPDLTEGRLDSMAELRPADHHQEGQEGRARPPWRRVEDRLCRLRDGDDGVLPAAVADLDDDARAEEGPRRLFRAANVSETTSGAGGVLAGTAFDASGRQDRRSDSDAVPDVATRPPTRPETLDAAGKPEWIQRRSDESARTTMPRLADRRQVEVRPGVPRRGGQHQAGLAGQPGHHP
jgi:hypothetical protein